MATNAAAWSISPKAYPLQVKPAPYPIPGPSDVIIQTAFVAINPLEYKLQDNNPPLGGRAISYPTIFGADLSGTVVEVGADVRTHKIGDRVIANAHGTQTRRPEMSAFQLFVLLPESSLTKVPDHLELEKAVVLPLACDTAAAGLFVKDSLGLSVEGLQGNGVKQDSTVLIWGGSSSVGCCAIQLACAAGYEVLTTASSRNHELCASLGAAKVFDHTSPNVENAIITALQGKVVVGALDCISDNETTLPACARILAETEGQKKIAAVLSPAKTKHDDVEISRLSIPALRATSTYNIVHEWKEKTLANGTLQPKPDPIVVGEGLQSIQMGIDRVRKGVSAAKVIVRLQ